LPVVKLKPAGLRGLLTIDQLDQPFFPRDGFSLYASAFAARKGLGADEQFESIWGRALGVHSWGDHTLNVSYQQGANPGSTEVYNVFRLGGPLRLSGYRIDQFAGQRYVFGRAMYYNRAVRLPTPLGAGLYFGASAEAGQVWHLIDGTENTGTLWSTSLFFAADTFLGPVYLGWGYGGGRNSGVYLLIGVP
jgi:NTE family protein